MPRRSLAFDRALALNPGHVAAWNNRGRALQALNRHDEAVKCFDQAIALQKDYADAHFNRALSLLTLGQLKSGFVEYEWRWKRSGMTDARRGYRGPLWLGEYPIGGKTILLYSEQGLGDSIHVCPLRAAAGARRGDCRCLKFNLNLKRCFQHWTAWHRATRAASPFPPMTCIARSAACRWRSRPSRAIIPADIPYLGASDSGMAKWQPVVSNAAGQTGGAGLGRTDPARQRP